jgi:hypothetical protein
MCAIPGTPASRLPVPLPAERSGHSLAEMTVCVDALCPGGGFRHVLGILFIPLMDLFDHRRHLPRVAATGADLNPYDGLRVRISAELNVVGGNPRRPSS